MVVKCSATNKDGGPCNAAPWRDGLCRWHHPALAAELAEGRRKGGAQRSNAARAKKGMVAAALTPAELQGYVAVALKGVLGGRLEPGVGNAVANLARAAVAVREATTLEERISELERAAGTSATGTKGWGS